MTKLLSVEEFRSAAKAGGRPAGTVLRASAGEHVAIEGTRKIRFCFSDGSVDRSGDTIDPNGWDLSGFKKNPVALFEHNSMEPPIGRAEAVQVEGAKLMGDIDFAGPEIYPFAETIYQLVRGKFMNAVSVGFLPQEWAFVEDKERGFGIDFKRQELLEISVVPVPCNANALGEARAKGIDTRPLIAWAEKLLDGGGKIILPRVELDRLRKAAKEPAMPKRPIRRDPAGLGEDDPAAGGALLATCARADGEDCGLKDSQECAVHRVEDEGEDKMTVEEIRKAIREEFKRLGVRRRGEPDDDEGDTSGIPEDHEKGLRSALIHVKAAGALYDAADEHHEEALKCLGKAVDDIGDPEAEGKSADDGDDDGDEGSEEHVRAAHEHMKAAADLTDQAEEHHDKAEDLLGKAVDQIDNPEAEGGEGGDKAQRRARARARAAAQRHRRETATK